MRTELMDGMMVKQMASLWWLAAVCGVLPACSSGTDDPNPVAPSGSAGAGATVGVGGGAPAAGAGAGAAPANTAGGSPMPTTQCAPLDPVPERLWRLSAEQFGNSVRDLIGLAQAPVLSNTGGTSQYAFFSDDSAVVDANLQYSIYESLQAVKTQITARIPQLTACTTGEASTACAQRFAQSFGQRAFRRPLEASEVTGLMQVYTAGGSNTDFTTGISGMIQALLMSPSFLHRSEVGTPTASATARTLSPFEVATQLSFMFTNSTPDTTLLAAASSGALATDQGITDQVDRLLKLELVKANISQVTLNWFNVPQLFIKAKDPAFFASLPAADQDAAGIEADLLHSTQQFINDVLWQGSGKINDLATSQKVFVNKRLATLYGYQFTGASPDQFVAVVDPKRAGMLTQPAFIWSMSDPATTSIVKRGKFIHDDIVCQDPGPSPGALLDDPAVQAKLAMLPTELDKSNYRMTTQPCQACHSQIDPYALVLQNFDPIGGYRTVADGVPVDPTGDFQAPSPLAGHKLTGAAAFENAIVTGNQLTNCAVQKISSYLIGRMIRKSNTCEVQQLQAEFAKSDGSILSLFRQVALAKFSRQRAGGAQ